MINRTTIHEWAYLGLTVRMKIVLIIAVMLLSSLTVMSQDFKVGPLPTQSQLPSSGIHCLFQDSEGYLWYGTERAGACRDNGYQVEVFCPSKVSSLAESDQILCIGETKDGDILLGTQAGLFRIDKKSYQLHAEGSYSEKVHTMLTDSEGHTWIALEGRVRLLGGKEIPCTSDGTQRLVVGLYEDHQGTLFALEWQGSMLCRKKGGQCFVPLKIPEHVKPVAMTEDRDHNCYWILTSNEGIVRLNTKGDSCEVTIQPTTLGDGAHRRGLGLLRDSRHSLLWATTMDNLYAYRVDADSGLILLPVQKHIGQEKKVLDQLLESRSGDIYVAGFMPQTFILSENPDKVVRLSVDPIRELSGYPLHADRCLREGEEFWIWHRRVGLVLYNQVTNRLTLAPWKVNPWFQRSLSREGGMWASRTNILYHVSQQGGTITREEICQMPDSAEVRCIHDDGMGTLYIATTRHLYRYSVVGHGLKAIATVDHVPTSITLSGSQLFWIADGRVFHITLADAKTGTPVRPAEVAGVQRATSLASRDDGSVWIATQGGKVFCIETQSGNLSEIGYMQSEHNAPLLDIDVDGMGHVWTLSDQQVREFCTQTQARRSFLASAPEIGVAQFSSIETDGTNSLSINGAGALCIVEASPTLNQPAVAVKPHLTAYQIDEDKYYAPTSDGEIYLQPDDVELTLYLTTFDYSAVNQISFAYQLEGISRDWVQTPVGSNVIHFTKLPAGTYALSVKATDRYGRWGSPVRIVTLRVLPVWYKTWWAQLLYLILLLLLGAGVWKLENRIQLLHRLIRRRESVRLDEIELKREDIMQNRLDDEFLSKAMQSVEAHLADTEFNVEALADAMCMSRANLHRRMKAQTDMSPTDFIRDIRLKKAAQLLLTQPEASISDIATRVGFATPKYFSRLFREKFGVGPKEYTGAEGPAAPSAPSGE